MTDRQDSSALPEIKIFLSSPGDVNEERILADRVMKRLADRYAAQARLVPIIWEHEPLLATATFQDQIEKPSTTDIVICILWSRLGTRLPAHIMREDGSRYDSGTEFEFEDAWKAMQSTGRPDLMVYRKMAEPYISLADDRDAEERLLQKRALDGFIQKWFHDQDGSLLAAFHGFSDSAEFEEAFEIHLDKLILRRLEELGVDVNAAPLAESATPRWEGSPFRGLESFEFEHAPIFYGRTQAVSKVLKALRRQAASGQAFALVLGRSGGGKSSLVRAGALPLLVEPGVVEGVGLWRRAVFRPSDASGNLVDAFAGALTAECALPELISDGTSVAELASLLRGTPQGADLLLKGALSQAAQKAAFEAAERVDAIKPPLPEAERAAKKAEIINAPPQARLALLVDQLEELFTDKSLPEAERQAFLLAIEALAKSGLVYVLATLRSDFYQHALDEPVLARLKGNEGQIDLSTPTPAEIGQIIRQPAMRAGLGFEEHPETGARLDDELRDVAVSEPDSLPLLEFTLEELYQNRSPQGLLTWAHYEALGGLAGALRQRAEGAFGALPKAAQEALPRVMRQIVHLGLDEDQAPTKRPAALSGFAPGTPERQLVDAFVEERLFVVGGDSAGEAQVTLTHEALLGSWPRLQDWLAADRDYLRIRARVSFAADRWEDAGRDAQLLLPKGRPLDEAKQLAAQADQDLPASMVALIAQSTQRSARARRLKQAAIAALAVLSVAASGAAWYADGQRREAAAAHAQAEQNAEAAEARQGELFLEQGRQALVSGRVEEATLLLGAAYQNSGEARVGTLFTQAHDLAAMRGATLQAHSGQITAIATSSAGQTALASSDGAILLRDQGSNAVVARHPGNDSALHSLAFSPSGQFLAAGGDGGTVLLWNLRDQQLRTLEGHFQSVIGLAFTDDEALLISRSHDKTTRIWQVSDGSALAPLAEPLGTPLAARYLPEGERVITASSGGVISTWDAATGAAVEQCEIEVENQIHDAVILGGHVVFAMGRAGTKSVSIAEGCAAIWHNSEPSFGLQDFDAGAKLAIRGEAGAAVLDMESGEILATLSRGGGAAQQRQVVALAVSPDKSLAGLLDSHGGLSIHDALSGRVIADVVAHDAAGSALAFADDGSLLLSGAADGTATTWHVGALRPCFVPESAGRVAVFSPDGARLASGDSKGTLTLTDTADCRQVFQVALGVSDWVQDIQFSGDGSRIAVAAGAKVALVQASDGAEIWAHERPADQAVASLDWEEGRSGLVAGLRAGDPWQNKGGWVELDPQTGAVTQESRGRESSIADVTVWNDGDYVLARARFGLELWWRHSGEMRHRVAGSGLQQVAPFPGKTRIAVGYDDGTVRVIRHTSSELFRFQAHDAPISALALNAEETVLASAAQDGTAALWDAQTGQLIARMEAQPARISAFAFVPETAFLLSAAVDGSVVLWDHSAGTAVSNFDGPAGARPRLSVGPKGHYFAVSVGNDGTRLWPLPRARHSVDEVPAEISAVTPWGLSADDAMPRDRWQSLALQSMTAAQAGEGLSLAARGRLEEGRLAAIRRDAIAAGAAWGQLPGEDGAVPPSPAYAHAFAANAVVLEGLQQVLRDHKDRVEHIAFSHDGAWLVSMDWKKRLLIWDTKTWTKAHEVEGGFGNTAVFSPDDTRLLAQAEEDTFVVLDMASAAEVLRLGQGVRGSWSRDGTRIAIFGRTGPPVIYDAQSGEEVVRFANLDAAATGYALSPDFRTLAAPTEEGVSLVRSVSRTVTPLATRGSAVEVSAFSPSGRYVAVIWEDGSGQVFDIEELDPIGHLPEGGLSVLFSADETRVIVGQRGQRVSLLALEGMRLLAEVEGSFAGASTIQGGGELFVTLDGGARAARLFDMQSGAHRGSHINFATAWMRLITAPDGQQRVTLSGDGALHVWAALARPGPMGPSSEGFAERGEDLLARHADGAEISRAGGKASLFVNGVASAAIDGHAGRITAAAFTDDGQSYLSGGEGGKVLIWNRETEQLGRTIPQACEDAVAALLPVPDGSALWVHCQGGDLHLFALSQGLRLVSFQAEPAAAAPRMEFAADGKALRLMGAEGPYLWRIAP
ncbi:hypothetical protein IV417_14385 [Alphaproteobacteria bacterium KMM 3653]|uniref:WD40 repeat protein n=1 Tax=Harenicola maris TaxID=2841044 RepID=A0AAP2G9M5_9RHOB|nr:hypothetical protein [Harenicola maris]